MSELMWVALAGFLASLVDGALGMGFGPTSSSILLGTGLSPAGVSATVNLAKVATGLAAAISHWRFRNIDHRLVLRLAIPGALGALVGVTVLANVDGDALRPILAVLLMAVGLRILLRFSQPLPVAAPTADEDDADPDPHRIPDYDAKGVEIAAGAGGITNGLVGAWGPVVTPFLLHRGLAPRWSVGSVNTAEVAVAAMSSGAILASLGGGGMKVSTLLAMLVGGILAAPIAAWTIRHLPARGMGVAVAGLLMLTNARELSNWQDLGAARWWAYGLVLALVALAALRPAAAARRAVPTEAAAA